MYVMVLNDGETYTSLEGCALIKVSESVDDADMNEMVKEIYTQDGKTNFWGNVEKARIGHVVTRFSS